MVETWRVWRRIAFQMVRLLSDVDLQHRAATFVYWLVRNQEERARSAIGPRTYFTGGSRFVRYAGSLHESVRVGAYTSVADAVTFMLDGNHDHQFVSMWADWPGGQPISVSRGPIVVGNDVWIGYQATVTSGVTIGDGAVVASHAVVTHDVEPYSIVAGIPAKHIGYRFPAETIARLLTVEWWNWPDSELESIGHLLQSPDLDAFFRYAERRAGGDSRE